MSRKRRDKECLADLVEAVHRIIDYTDNLTYVEFLADKKTQDAVLRNIQVIGEAVKKLSPLVKQFTHVCLGSKWQGCVTRSCTTISELTMISSGLWPSKSFRPCCHL